MSPGSPGYNPAVPARLDRRAAPGRVSHARVRRRERLPAREATGRREARFAISPGGSSLPHGLAQQGVRIDQRAPALAPVLVGQAQQHGGSVPGHRRRVQLARRSGEERLLGPRCLGREARVLLADAPDRGEEGARVELDGSLTELLPVDDAGAVAQVDDVTGVERPVYQDGGGFSRPSPHRGGRQGGGREAHRRLGPSSQTMTTSSRWRSNASDGGTRAPDGPASPAACRASYSAASELAPDAYALTAKRRLPTRASKVARAPGL